MKIKVNQYYRENSTGEVYCVQKVGTDKSVTVAHTVKEQAWSYRSGKHLLEEMSLLTGKDSERAEILHDVILQLNTKRFVASAGNYVELDGDSEFQCLLGDAIDYNDKHGDEGAKSFTEVQAITSASKECRVCAMGSLFVSAVDIHDKLQIKDIKDPDGDPDPSDISIPLANYLNEWFPIKEQRHMEYVFEGYMLSDVNKPYFNRDVMLAFRKAIPNETEDALLRAIIANTLKFGAFSPEKGLV